MDLYLQWMCVGMWVQAPLWIVVQYYNWQPFSVKGLSHILYIMAHFLSISHRVTQSIYTNSIALRDSDVNCWIIFWKQFAWCRKHFPHLYIYNEIDLWPSVTTQSVVLVVHNPMPSMCFMQTNFLSNTQKYFRACRNCESQYTECTRPRTKCLITDEYSLLATSIYFILILFSYKEYSCISCFIQLCR